MAGLRRVCSTFQLVLTKYKYSRVKLNTCICLLLLHISKIEFVIFDFHQKMAGDSMITSLSICASAWEERSTWVMNVSQCSLCITHVCDSYTMNIYDHVKSMFHLSYNINHTYSLSLVLLELA